MSNHVLKITATKKGTPTWLNNSTNDSPDWLNNSEIIAEEKHNSSGFKKGTPEWLQPKEPSSHIKSGTPNWLKQSESGSIVNEGVFTKNANWDLDYLTTKQRLYLEARGFLKYCKGHNPKVVKGIISQIQYMERRIEQQITLEKVIKSELPMIREKAELEELEDLKIQIQKEIKQIEPDLIINEDFLIPTKDSFTFNTNAESQHYQLTHVPFDVENNLQDQTPGYCAAYNYEANRYCLALNTKKYPKLTGLFKYIKVKAKNRSIDVYLIGTPNLWEALFVADVELIVSVICESALMSGHNHLRSALDKIHLPKKLKINFRLLEECLNGFPKRRSTWIAHNARFDIDMLNDTAKKANYKFTFFQKRLEHSKIKYYMGRAIDPEKLLKDKKIKDKVYNVNHYTVHLGNRDAGFKFRISVDNANGKTIFRTNLSPIQDKTFTHLWITDTIQVSFALQNPEHGLKYVSKDSEFKKLAFPDLNFPIEEMNIFEQEKITKPAKYLMFDTFATIAGYSSESHQLNYSEMEKLIQDNGLPDFELKTDWRPRMSSLLSTATIAKQFIFPYLEAKTGLKRKAIENNIIHERMYQSNFELVYSGGISEPTIYGILESNFPTKELVIYDDFESLYPSIARLVFADLMYQLAAKKELHTYLRTDTKQTKQDFWDNIERIVKIIRQALKGKQTELPEDIFQSMIGTAQINTIHPLQIRVKENKKRIWKKIKGKVHIHLIDLMNSIIRAVIEDNTPIEVLYNQIHFIKTERFDFRNIPVPEFGNEFFTLLIKLRREKIIAGDTIEKMLKYIINSGIGISAEGISNKEDFTGKLFIPVIFASVTAGSRFLIAIPEIMCKKLGGEMGYTDTDSIIYKIKKSVRKHITQLFTKISMLKEEKDYGKIHKTFISKKKKYYLLSENIKEKKFKNQFIKLENGHYIVGKVHGLSSYEKKLYVETAFPIANELFENMTIENAQESIKFAVRKFIHKHPRFMKITYKKKTEAKIKGILYFYQKTRNIKIKYERDNEKTESKIRIPNPVITLYTGKFDEFDIHFYYDLSSNNLLISNLKDKPIRSNFGIYANLGNNKVKIFSTLPFREEHQLDWENRFLKFIIKTFKEQYNHFYKRIQHKQAEFIVNFRETVLKSIKGEFDEHINFTTENIEDKFNYVFTTLKPPIPKTKHFFDRTYQPELFKDMKFDKKTKDWYDFTETYGDWLTAEYGVTSGDVKQIVQSEIEGDGQYLKFFSKLAQKVGFQSIQPPTVREMRSLASEYSIPDRSKMSRDDLWFWVKDFWYKKYQPDKEIEHLILRIQSDYQHYSFDGSAYGIIDAIMDTNTYDYNNYLATIDNKVDTNKIEERDYQDIKGFQLFNQYFQQIVRIFQKEAIAKTDLETKLIKQFTYNKEDTFRYISETKTSYLKLEVENKKKKVEAPEMLTHTILNHEYFTDGVDYRLWSYLPELDFSEELVANQNTFYSKILVNFGRIGSYIYLLTHNRAKQIPKMWDLKAEECPCPKTNTQIHIPLRMRLLLDLNKTTFTENEIKLAYNSFEIKKLLNKGILGHNEKQKAYKIKDLMQMVKFTHKNVYEKAYMIFGKEKPENHTNQFPIYNERKYCGQAYAFEILTSKGYEYNSKLYIKILVGENKQENKRIVSCDLHINPNSHNLLNIELLKVNIQDLERDDFIVKELFKGLFTIKELAIFSRNASLTTEDMQSKKELQYLRKATYLFFTHAILEDAIINNSQTKIGMLALTGQMKPKNITPKNLFSHLNTAIVDSHEEWIHTLDPSQALRVQAREISVLPHRASFGITTNHWKKGIHLSLYTKDRHWYKSKFSRTARSRNFEITPALSEKVMNEIWEENTIRYEITLKGFEAIHCKEFHAILHDLEQFFFQLDKMFLKEKKSVKSFNRVVNKIRQILPEPLFSTIYETAMSKIISITGKKVNTKINSRGYSERERKPDIPDPPPNPP